MKKSLPIILLSVFTLAFSAFGFMGIQPVKAATSVAGITIEDGAVGYEGVSITHADQQTNEDGEAVSSGDGKMKFYSSLTQSLYNSLKGKDYKTGTLIIPAELLQGESVADKLNTLDITKVGVNGAINVETTSVWTLYDVDNDKVADDADDAYWAMASLYNIPRAYYGVEMAARSYLAIKADGASDYTYVYSATNDVTTFYSLTTAALKKLEAGDYNAPESTDDNQVLTELGQKITDDYTMFKVTFHFDDVNKDMEGFVESKTVTLAYGSVLPRLSSVYYGTHFAGYYQGARQYTNLKGFYNEDRTVLAVQIGASMEAGDVTTAVGGSSKEGDSFYYYTQVNDNFMTRVYGDMNLYEEIAPANLIDDFSTAQSVNAAYDRQDATTYTYRKHYQNEDAAWYEEVKDVNGVTESGVLAIPSRVTADTNSAKKTHHFFLSSTLRNHYFWSNSYCQTTYIDTDGDGKNDTYVPTNPDDCVDITSKDFYTGEKMVDYDYVNVRIMVESSDASITEVALQGVYGIGNYAGQNPAKTPVNTWVNIRFERAHMERVFNSLTFSSYRANNSSGNGLISVVSSTAKEEGTFTLYVDYMAYERDMRISVNGKDGWDVSENKHSHSATNPYSVKYDYSKMASVIGEEIALGTALTNGTINYTVTDPDGENVTLSGDLLNKFTPTKLGTYTVKATCDDYALLANDYPAIDFTSKQYGEVSFEVVSRKVTPTLKNAEGTAIDLATAFNIGNAVTIDFKVEGVDTILPESTTYIVKYLADDSTVVVTDGAFTPLNAGQYSVVVKYVDANGYESASEEIILDTVGRVITPAFSVGGEVIDINNPIFMDSVVTISAVVEGVDAPVAENFSYEVVRLDSVESNNVELEVVDGQFTAYYKGTYNIFVYYKEGQVTHASEMVTLTVKVDGRYINDFSDSTSTVAVYRVDYLKGDANGSGGTYSSSDSTHKAKYTADDIAPNTTWVPEHEGRYGVIKTKPQGDNKSQYTTDAGKATEIQSRLGIYLRSADYRTINQMIAAGVTDVVYGQSAEPSNVLGNMTAYNCANWDYISVPVFFPAPEGKTSADTIKISIMYGSQLFDVPYDTWYELQLDKPRMVMSFAGSNIVRQFANSTSWGNPALFYIAQSDETAAANLNQEVYIDSISFEKYEGYERFDYLKFYNVTDNEVAPNVYEFEHYSTGGTTYVALEEKDFVLQARAGGKDIEIANLTLRYQTWANNMQMTYYAAGDTISDESGYTFSDDKTISRGSSGYVSNNNKLYRIHVKSVASTAGKIDTTKASYYSFCYDYTDAETNKKYRGYVALACKAVLVDAPTA